MANIHTLNPTSKTGHVRTMLLNKMIRESISISDPYMEKLTFTLKRIWGSHIVLSFAYNLHFMTGLGKPLLWVFLLSEWCMTLQAHRDSKGTHDNCPCRGCFNQKQPVQYCKSKKLKESIFKIFTTVTLWLWLLQSQSSTEWSYTNILSKSSISLEKVRNRDAMNITEFCKCFSHGSFLN